MKEYYSVIIADDHEGVRKGIKRLLEKNGEFEVIGMAKDGKEAVQLVRQKEPDLLILDVKLPILRGQEVAYRLTESVPDVRILAISSFDSPQYILGMLENGARGYLTKEEAPALLRKAARDIMLNDATQWISEKLKQQTGITFIKDEKTVVRLSATEKQIMAFLKEGHTETEIARELAFSTSRVKRYIQILLMKYEVSSIEALLEVA
jgi:DNA-binding NarL/FixJ family response regulator